MSTNEDKEEVWDAYKYYEDIVIICNWYLRKSNSSRILSQFDSLEDFYTCVWLRMVRHPCPKQYKLSTATYRSIQYVLWSVSKLRKRHAIKKPTPEVLIEDPSVLDDTKQVDLEELLEKCSQYLNERSQRILRGYYAQGLTMREIGDQLNISESYVSLQRKRILARLQRCLKEGPYENHHSSRQRSGAEKTQ